MYASERQPYVAFVHTFNPSVPLELSKGSYKIAWPLWKDLPVNRLHYKQRPKLNTTCPKVCSGRTVNTHTYSQPSFRARISLLMINEAFTAC